jgi:hypothetical protein
VCVGALFALASAKQKECEQNESAERERKKREFALFPPSHTGSPVSEPEDARQGKSKGLE